MKLRHAIAFSAVIAALVAILFEASHGHPGLFYNTEGSLGVFVIAMLTWFSCGTSKLKSLVTTITTTAPTDEQREQAAFVLENSGRLAHSVAAVLSFVALITMFRHLGMDVGAVGGSYAVSLMSIFYATVYSELIAAPVHSRIAPKSSRWSLTPLMASGLIAMLVSAAAGFGTYACPSNYSAPPTSAPVPSSTAAEAPM